MKRPGVGRVLKSALQAAVWYYEEVARRRLGLPDNEEGVRAIRAMPWDHFAECLTPDEAAMVLRYELALVTWDSEGEPASEQTTGEG